MSIRRRGGGGGAAAGLPRSAGGAAPGHRAGPTVGAVVRVLAGSVAVLVCLTLAVVPTASAQPAVSSTGMSSAALPPWPVLRQGSNSSWPPVTVRSLQYLLNARGARLDVDGILGPRTDAAVRVFQQAHGLVVDGIVGQRTWSSVILTVQRGNVGPAVRAVQDQANFRNLRGEGPPTLQIDVVFGADTDTWVRGYQSAVAVDVPGFPVDGIVGPLTWQALVTETLSG